MRCLAILTSRKGFEVGKSRLIRRLGRVVSSRGFSSLGGDELSHAKVLSSLGEDEVSQSKVLSSLGEDEVSRSEVHTSRD